MSPRAAWRLETLGFKEVYDYAAGKADWFAMGRPMEGALASLATIGTLAERDVSTCSLDESAAEVAERTKVAGWDTCVVLAPNRVVLGRVDGGRAEGVSTDATAGDAMVEGPSTFRPNVAAREMASFMRKHGLDLALVTTAGGVFVGLIRRVDVEARVHGLHG